MDSSTQPLIKHKCFLPALASFLAFLFLSFHFTTTSRGEVALLLPSLLKAPEPPPSITTDQQNLTQFNAADIEEGSAAPAPEKIAAPPGVFTLLPALLKAPEPSPSITTNQQNLTQFNTVDIEEGSAGKSAPAPAPAPALEKIAAFTLLPSLLKAPEPSPSITTNQPNLTQFNTVDIEEGSAGKSVPVPAPAPAPSPAPEKIAAPPAAAVTAQPPAENPESREGAKCDVSDGKWVYDPENYPLYKVKQCPFLSEQVTCRRNGRPDAAYQGWRWEPRGCKIPRFNGTHMLEILRGKRLIIVGDSLNRNQWESLACLLYSSVRSSRTFVRTRHSVRIFRAKDYGCSIEFFWSPFLVKMDVLNDGLKILKIDKLSESARQWQGADIMVFNTGHWWTHHGRKKPWKYFEHRGELIEKMKGFTAFEIGMKTWAHWIDQKVDPTKTTVIFRSFSPVHKKVNLQWCYGQMQPITNETYAQWFPRPMVSIIQKTISEMRTAVTYLNITRMSEYRQDAHTSVYTTRHEKALTKDEKNQPDEFADCNHWCLPGVPDAWNELLYASIIGSPLVLR